MSNPACAFTCRGTHTVLMRQRLRPTQCYNRSRCARWSQNRSFAHAMAKSCTCQHLQHPLEFCAVDRNFVSITAQPALIQLCCSIRDPRKAAFKIADGSQLRLWSKCTEWRQTGASGSTLSESLLIFYIFRAGNTLPPYLLPAHAVGLPTL